MNPLPPSPKSYSKWCNLPSDVLTTIAELLDPIIGTLTLCSTCQSWRSSLSLSSKTTTTTTSSLIITFPLHLPLSLSLLQRTTYLISPPNNPKNPFLIKLQPTTTPNTFSLLDPLTSQPLTSNKPPHSTINLLDFSVSTVSVSYVLAPFKKVVVSSDFDKSGVFVLLVLTHHRSLMIWRYGDHNWKEIVSNGRLFDDVVCYRDKFYATVNGKGGLVMIDSRLHPIDLVYKLDYGNGKSTHLVESHGDLYLVDRVRINNQGLGLGFQVFKLDEKGRFWDYEFNLNGCVFFIGSHDCFSVSMRGYEGCVRDCIYFVVNEGEGCKDHGVFDVIKSRFSLVAHSESFQRFYCPPWCRDDAIEE